jgi:hypothetical protein
MFAGVLQALLEIPVPNLSALNPVLEGIVDQKVVTAQSTTCSVALTTVSYPCFACVLQAFFKIPVPTLPAPIPVLEGIVDQTVVTAQ